MGKRHVQEQTDSRDTELWSMTTVLAVATAIIFLPILDPESTFGGMDFFNLLLPHAYLVKDAFKQGVVPLWNWYTWGGSPLLAEMLSAPLYPPMWLALVAPLPYALQLFAFAHLVFAAVGAALLARRGFTITYGASLLSGVAYAGSGVFLGHIEQTSPLAAIAWTPWLILASIGYLRGNGNIIWLGLAVALAFFAGHPQYVAFGLLFLTLAVWVWVTGVYRGEHVRFCTSRLWRVAGWHLGVAGGLMFAAAQLFPAVELSRLSERIWPYEDPYSPSFHAQHVLAFVIPRFFNRLVGTHSQPVGFTEEEVYAGMLTAVLVCVSAMRGLRLRDRRTMILIGGLLLAVAFALGPDGGLALLIYSMVPVTSVFRGTARALNIASLCWALLAGMGLDFLLAQVKYRWARKWFERLAFTVVVTDVTITHAPELRSLLVSVELLNERPPRVITVQPTSTAPNRLYRFMANDSDYYLDHRAAAVIQRLYRLQPNTNVFYRIAVLDGYEEGLLPTWRLGNFLRRYNRNLRNAIVDGSLLSLLGVNRVLTEYPVVMDSPFWKQASESPIVLGGLQYSVWENVALPSWFYDEKTLYSLAVNGQSVSRDADWPSLTSEHGDIGQRNVPKRIPTAREAVRHPFSDRSPEVFRLASTNAHMRVSELRPNAILVETDGPFPSAVIFSQVFYPGWKVRDEQGRVIGQVTWAPPILTRVTFSSREADGLPGRVAFTVRYEPFSFRFGAFVSLISLVCGLFCLLYHRRQRRVTVLRIPCLTPRGCPSGNRAYEHREEPPLSPRASGA